MKRSLAKTSIVFGTLILFTISAHAQSTLGTSVNVDMNPRVPNPGQTVTITVTSYSTDLNQATFDWAVNGVTRKNGRGITTLDVTAPGLGATSIVDITINTKDIGEVSKRVTISPAAVDIIEEPSSYTPPFYRGKSLPSVEGDITLLAIPNLITSGGRKLSVNEISFKWSRNGTVLGDQSGVGKNTITVKGPYLSSQVVNMTVEVSSPENNLTAQAFDTLVVRDPQIIFYENNPLLGLRLNRALTNTFNLTEKELALFAVPYFFNENVLRDFKTTFNWKINGLDVNPTENSRNILTVRSPGGSGSSLISLTVTNSATIFQTTQSSLGINFSDGGNGSVHF